MQNLHAPLVRYHIEQPGVIAHGDGIRLLLGGQVPAEVVEELLEAELLEVFLIEGGHLFDYFGIKPKEHTTRGSRRAAVSSA